MPRDLHILLTPLPDDLIRVVWCEYTDCLRVRMLHYQLTRKFRHWRSLPMATHAGMIQDIVDYRGRFLYQDLSHKHLFIATGWDPATSEWFATDYVICSWGEPNVPPLTRAAHSNTLVHAAWWSTIGTSRQRFRLEPPRSVWVP